MLLPSSLTSFEIKKKYKDTVKTSKNVELTISKPTVSPCLRHDHRG